MSGSLSEIDWNVEMGYVQRLYCNDDVKEYIRSLSRMK